MINLSSPISFAQNVCIQAHCLISISLYHPSCPVPPAFRVGRFLYDSIRQRGTRIVRAQRDSGIHHKKVLVVTQRSWNTIGLAVSCMYPYMKCIYMVWPVLIVFIAWISWWYVYTRMYIPDQLMYILWLNITSFKQPTERCSTEWYPWALTCRTEWYPWAFRIGMRAASSTYNIYTRSYTETSLSLKVKYKDSGGGWTLQW